MTKADVLANLIISRICCRTNGTTVLSSQHEGWYDAAMGDCNSVGGSFIPEEDGLDMHFKEGRWMPQHHHPITMSRVCMS